MYINILLDILTTEYDIIQACARGDVQAQKWVYDQYKRPLMGICRRYCASREQAQDVLQESFIKIFTKINTYNGSGNFQGWMSRIVINTAISMNTRWDNRKVEQDIANYDRPDDTLNGLQNLTHQELLSLIEKLPTGYRTIFNLYIIDGFSHDEIGKMLGISEGTSKSQLSRAKALLAQWITGLNKYETNRLKHEP